MDAVLKIANLIIGRALNVSESLARTYLGELTRQLGALYERGLQATELEREGVLILRRVLRAYLPPASQALADSIITGWVAGNQIVARRTPKRSPKTERTVALPDPLQTLYPPHEPERVIRFPILEEAAADLQARQLVTPKVFYEIGNVARRRAWFTVSGVEEATVAKYRDVMREAVQEGWSGETFGARLTEAGIASPLGPGHQQNVYRTTIQTVLRAGAENLLANPIVGNQFPYVENLSIRDSRRTSLCAIISRSGIQGTGIYRRDDPVWREFAIPRHWQDRCSANYLPLEMAARKGIQEAQDWLSTGRPPKSPAYVPWPQLDAEAQELWDQWRANRTSA